MRFTQRILSFATSFGHYSIQVVGSTEYLPPFRCNLLSLTHSATLPEDAFASMASAATAASGYSFGRDLTVSDSTPNITGQNTTSIQTTKSLSGSVSASATGLAGIPANNTSATTVADASGCLLLTVTMKPPSPSLSQAESLACSLTGLGGLGSTSLSPTTIAVSTGTTTSRIKVASGTLVAGGPWAGTSSGVETPGGASTGARVGQWLNGPSLSRIIVGHGLQQQQQPQQQHLELGEICSSQSGSIISEALADGLEAGLELESLHGSSSCCSTAYALATPAASVNSTTCSNVQALNGPSGWQQGSGSFVMVSPDTPGLDSSTSGGRLQTEAEYVIESVRYWP
ncbi:unnamed protein product [Protopolystoma xenopodis]|uniref:Uncharacterized protein n=1 Tax=Protopolystoma xenopodis TaxID=117903 RepID=A0A448X5B3_9PLAT|nr:unnamed protein product [Protopolystoma xenopodis]